MEKLLKEDFTDHYSLPVSTVANITTSTTAAYFELKDDRQLVYNVIGEGFARYNNAYEIKITVINFEAFINSLPPVFIKNKEKCDLIVHDEKQKHILLNELTNTAPKYVEPYENIHGAQPGKRAKATSQLISSLNLLLNVPTIAAFAHVHVNKRCCFFNKQSVSPPTIIATTAFNRLSQIADHGFKMSNTEIEALVFEFWEYSGDQVYSL